MSLQRHFDLFTFYHNLILLITRDTILDGGAIRLITRNADAVHGDVARAEVDCRIVA